VKSENKEEKIVKLQRVNCSRVTQSWWTKHLRNLTSHIAVQETLLLRHLAATTRGSTNDVST